MLPNSIIDRGRNTLRTFQDRTDNSTPSYFPISRWVLTRNKYPNVERVCACPTDSLLDIQVNPTRVSHGLATGGLQVRMESGVTTCRNLPWLYGLPGVLLALVDGDKTMKEGHG